MIGGRVSPCSILSAPGRCSHDGKDVGTTTLSCINKGGFSRHSQHSISPTEGTSEAVIVSSSVKIPRILHKHLPSTSIEPPSLRIDNPTSFVHPFTNPCTISLTPYIFSAATEYPPCLQQTVQTSKGQSRKWNFRLVTKWIQYAACLDQRNRRSGR